LAVRVRDYFGIGQLVRAAHGDQPDRTVRERVLDPLGVAAVGERDPVAVFRPEDQDRGAVDGARTTADVDHDAHPGHEARNVDGDGVGHRAVEPCHPPAEARLLRGDERP
jgi:hypothetical protein